MKLKNPKVKERVIDNGWGTLGITMFGGILILFIIELGILIF